MEKAPAADSQDTSSAAAESVPTASVAAPLAGEASESVPPASNAPVASGPVNSLTTGAGYVSAPPPLARIGSRDFLEAGEWMYICVDPTGLRLRKDCVYAKSAKADGAQISFSEMVLVSERGKKDGYMWLRLADERGWAFEKTNRLRMSEVCNQEVDEELRQPNIIIRPDLKEGVKVSPVPIPSSTTTAATRSSTVGASQLHPGTPILVQGKCTVSMQDGPGSRPKIFLRVVDDVGTQGWIPEEISGKRTFTTYTTEPLAMPGSGTLWIAIAPGSKANIYLAPGRSEVPIATVEKCELLEIVPERFNADGLSFCRLAAGGWICETNPNGTIPFLWVSREPHWWIYTVASRDGTAIRQLPCRDKRLNTGRTLKRGVEVRCCEKVAFPDGEAYIRLEPPHQGWVPLMRTNGETKMIAEHEVPPGVVPIDVPAVVAPTAKATKEPGGLGSRLGRGLTSAFGAGEKKNAKASATE